MLKLSRRHTILCALLFFLLLFSSCSFSGMPAQELQGTLKISGSTALGPLLDRARTLFEQQYPHVTIDIAETGSIQGLQDVVSGKVHIGSSDVYADFARYPDPNLTDHLICVIPFTMIVHPDLPVSSLTQEQIVRIFTTPEVLNWQEFGGPDLTIQPFVRKPSSGTRDTLSRPTSRRKYANRLHLIPPTMTHERRCYA